MWHVLYISRPYSTVYNLDSGVCVCVCVCVCACVRVCVCVCVCVRVCSTAVYDIEKPPMTDRGYYRFKKDQKRRYLTQSHNHPITCLTSLSGDHTHTIGHSLCVCVCVYVCVCVCHVRLSENHNFM